MLLLTETVLQVYVNIRSLPTLQIRAGQWSITANLWPSTTHIYHAMITVTRGFSKNFFIVFGSSSTQIFFKTGVIRNFTTFTGKHVLESNLMARNFI